MRTIFRYLVKLLAVFSIVELGVATAFAADCNNNSADDSVDITTGSSVDCNQNGKPDECDVSVSGVSFGAAAEFSLETSIGTGFQPLSLLPTYTADFNNDGKLDLWGSISSPFTRQTALFVYINQGDNQTFTPQVLNLGAGPYDLTSVSRPAAVDADNDGDIDIIFAVRSSSLRPASYGQAVQVWRNDGAGNFTFALISISPPIPAVPATDPGAFSFVPTHFSSSTGKDLAILSGGRIYALYRTDELNYISFDMGSAASTGEARFADVAESLAYHDALVAYGDRFATASFYAPIPGALERTFFQSYLIPGRAYANALLRPGEFGSDILALGAEARYMLSAYPDSGTGSTSLIHQPPSGVGDVYFYSANVSGVTELDTPADFNSDGAADILLKGENHAELLLNEGTGQFQQRLKIFGPAGKGRLLALADFNSDNKPDFLFGGDTLPKATLVLNSTTYPLTDAISADQNGNGVPDECQRAVPGDFTGDGRSEFTVVRSLGSQLLWFMLDRSTSASHPEYSNPTPRVVGKPGDRLMAGDYDGDGKIDPAVVSNAPDGQLAWRYLRLDNTAVENHFGLPGDYPMPGYFDSDRILDRAVARPIFGGLLWIIDKSTGGREQFFFGLTSDQPFVGDMDGDGVDEVGIYRTVGGGVFWTWRTLGGTISPLFQFGLVGDKVFQPLDVDGNGIDDLVVARTEAGKIHWFERLFRPTGYSDLDFFDGLSGEEPFLSHLSGHAGAEVASRSKAGFPYGRFRGRLGHGAEYREKQFGLHDDVLIGADGRAATQLGLRGALRCPIVGHFGDGPGGYLWNPYGTKPLLTVPSAVRRNLKSVTLASGSGIIIDTMKLKSGNTYQSRIHPYWQLSPLIGLDSLVAQLEIGRNQFYCYDLSDPNFPAD